MFSKFQKNELETLLEIYRQKYEHVRHLQQMRATYFNFYIIVIGFAIAAMVNIYGNAKWLPPQLSIPIGLLIWCISALSIIRAERWGGHISHDLRIIREIQNVFVGNFKIIGNLIPFNPTPLNAIEFDRPLWNRNRSIETPTSMLSAILSSIFIALSMPSPLWAQISIGILLVFLSILLWRSEVSNQKKAHKSCCIR